MADDVQLQQHQQQPVATLTFDTTRAVYPRQFDPAFPARPPPVSAGGGQGQGQTYGLGQGQQQETTSRGMTLPRAARLDLSSCEGLHAPLTHSDVILIEARRTVKCVARPLEWDSRDQLYTYHSSPSFLIPMNFPGWLCYLEEYGDKVKQYTTVGEMAKAAAASHVTGFVTSQPCECLVSAVRKSPLTRRAHQYAVRGVLETGEVLYPDGVLRASLSSSGRRRRRNSFLCRRSSSDDVSCYVTCTTGWGRRVLLDYAQTGSFFALRPDSAHTNGSAFLLSDVIDHVSSSAPIRVKLIVNDDVSTAAAVAAAATTTAVTAGGGESSNSHTEVSAFELSDIICENVIIASELRQLKLFEIPVSSRVKMHLANNDDRIVTQFMKRTASNNNGSSRCDSEMFVFLNAIKESHVDFWNHFAIDEDKAAAAAAAAVTSGSSKSRDRMIELRQQQNASSARTMSAACRAEDESDDYATLPARTVLPPASNSNSNSNTADTDGSEDSESRRRWRALVVDVHRESEEGYLMPALDQHSAPSSRGSRQRLDDVTSQPYDGQADNGHLQPPLTVKRPSMDRPAAPLPFKHVYGRRSTLGGSVTGDDVEYVNDVMDVASDTRSSIISGMEGAHSGRSRFLSSASEYQILGSRQALMQKLSERLDSRLRLEMSPVMDGNVAGGSAMRLGTSDLLPSGPPAASNSHDSGFTASSLSLCNDSNWVVTDSMHEWIPLKEVKDMSVEEVCAALMHIGFNRHVADLFLAEQVDGQQLAELTDELLKDAFPTLNGLQRKKVLDFARGWRPRRWKSTDLGSTSNGLDELEQHHEQLIGQS